MQWIYAGLIAVVLAVLQPGLVQHIFDALFGAYGPDVAAAAIGFAITRISWLGGGPDEEVDPGDENPPKEQPQGEGI